VLLLDRWLLSTAGLLSDGVPGESIVDDRSTPVVERSMSLACGETTVKYLRIMCPTVCPAPNRSEAKAGI
jgi:hypothetical protein